MLKSPWMLLAVVPLGFALLAGVATSKAGRWTGAATVFAGCGVLAFGVGALSLLQPRRAMAGGPTHDTPAGPGGELAAFVRGARRRNLRDTLFALAFAGLFGAGFASEEVGTVAWWGRAVLVAAWLLVLAVVWGRLDLPVGELATRPPGDHPEHWRSRLTTQAGWLRLAWLWGGLPLMAGFGLLLFGRANVSPSETTLSLTLVAGFLALSAVANLRAAARLERDRDRWLGAPADAE